MLLVQFFHQTWEVAFEEVSVEPGDVTNDNYGQLVSGVRGGGGGMGRGWGGREVKEGRGGGGGEEEEGRGRKGQRGGRSEREE